MNQPAQSIRAKAFRGELAPLDPADEPASELLERIREERRKQAAERTPAGGAQGAGEKPDRVHGECSSSPES